MAETGSVHVAASRPLTRYQPIGWKRADKRSSTLMRPERRQLTGDLVEHLRDPPGGGDALHEPPVQRLLSTDEGRSLHRGQLHWLGPSGHAGLS